MSRAEKKLAELKAKAELARLKAEKNEKQQQDLEAAKEKWDTLPSTTRRTIKIISVVVVVIGLIGAFSSTQEQKPVANTGSQKIEQSTQEPEPAVVAEKTPKEKLQNKILNLISTEKAFDPGSYVKGDIPKGEYAFIPLSGGSKYYSEDDAAGNIIDNENFSSFGYVYVHAAGNISTGGLLVSEASLKDLGVKGAKDIYLMFNDLADYNSAAMYKVGKDIEPGKYILESLGSGYVAILTGPVGNNEIVDNANFNGRYSLSVSAGQYLSLNRAEIVK